MDNLNADVDSFFSKFDEKEDAIDMSESVTDKSEVDTKETKEVATTEDDKVDTSKESDKSEDNTDDKTDTPFHEHPRWKEVMKERTELRESQKGWEKEKQELNDRLSKLESKPLSDDELSEMTPKEIQEHTRKELEKEYQFKSESSKKETDEADRYINEALSDIKDAGFDFDENKLLTIAEKYTEGNIEKAFELYQQLGDTKKQGAEQEAKSAAKLKAAESNKSNRGAPGKSTGFVSGTGWGDLSLT